MNKTYLAIAAFMLCSLAGVARAEMIDNPLYKHWAQFKPGTWVTVKQTSEMAGQKSITESTTKVLEVTAEQVVLEVSGKMEAQGQKIDMPARKDPVLAKIPKPEAVATPQEVKDAPKPKEGEDTVTTAGKPIKCKTLEITFDANGQKGTTKTWMNEEIPGQMIKMETKSAAMSVILELVAFEKK
jgi:hypothetical protein